MQSRRIVEKVDRLDATTSLLIRRGVGGDIRPARAGVAMIHELAQIAFAAEGAVDAHRVESRELSGRRSVEVRLRALAFFVDETAGRESIKPIGGGDRMRLIAGNGPGEQMGRTGSGFESAGSPAAIHI